MDFKKTVVRIFCLFVYKIIGRVQTLIHMGFWKNIFSPKPNGYWHAFTKIEVNIMTTAFNILTDGSLGFVHIDWYRFNRL